jgi:ABC-type transport system substrate-binding protein
MTVLGVILMTQTHSMRSRVLRRVGVAVATAIAISTVASTGSQATANPSAAKYGGEAKVGIFDTFPGFCVGNNPANSALMAVRSMYETLFERTVGGDYVGLLASGAVASADLKTWTVTLREGITFHDGAAFNAAAVVTNYQATTGLIAAGAYAAGAGAAAKAGGDAAAQATAGLTAYATKGYTVGTGAAFAANIKSFSAKSTYVVEFILDRAQNDFLGTLYASGRGFMRSPAQLATSTACASAPVGTGPFKLVSWSTDQLIVAKNASYWRTDPVTNAKLPYLDKITFSNVKEGSQRSSAVRTGTLDAGMFTAGSEATFIKDLRLRKSLVNEYKSPVEYYPSLWLNQGKPGSPFANKNARLALLSCIDRVNYVKVRSKGETTVAKSLVGPKSDMYSTSGFSKFDVKASKAFVAAYKKETGKADLTFSMPSDQSSASQANAKFLVEQWKKCGITANVVVEESAVIIAKAFNAAPKVAAGEFYNAYDMIPILLFEGTDVTFNLPFVVTNAFPATSTSPVKALFQNSVGVVLSLNHHKDTAVDTIFYAGQAAQTRTGAKVKYKEGTTYLQTNGFMGSINHIYYSVFTTKKLAGIGSLQLVKGKTQRVVTNFGIDWTGVYKTA